MRIKSLDVANFLCHRVQRLQFSGCDLVAGFNGAGKTSLLESLRVLFLGDSRVSLKKHWDRLVLEGHKKAAIRAVFELDEGDPEQQLEIQIPKSTKPTGQGVDSPVLPFLLAAKEPTSLSSTELRELVFTVGNVQYSHERLREELAHTHISETNVDSIVAEYRAGGFPKAEQKAGDLLRAARQFWKNTTGEVYGAEKAADWTPAGLLDQRPDYDLAALAAAEKEAEQELEQSLSNQGKASAALSGEALAKLRANADQIPVLQEQVTTVEAEMNTTADRVRALQAQGKSLAANAALECPHCHAAVSLRDGVLVDSLPQSEIDQQLESIRADLRLHLDAHKLLKEQFAKAQEQLVQAKTDQRSLQSASSVDSSVQDADWDAAVATARRSLQSARQELQVARNALREYESGLSVAAKASAIHRDVLGLQQAVSLLSPDGIPAQCLLPILDRCNAILAEFTEAAQWPEIAVDRDFVVTFQGRPVFLVSESERWRVDAALAFLFAELSGLRFLVLDRVDVLDLLSRAQLFRWAYGISKTGFQVIMAATLKEKPNFPFPVIWLDKADSSESDTQAA